MHLLLTTLISLWLGWAPAPGSPQAKPVELTTENFEAMVLQAKQPVLVDFWATWCGPCRAIAPSIEALATEMEGQALIGKVDVDRQRQLASRYGIRSIPTLLIFKDGKVVDKIVGLKSKEAIERQLRRRMD